MLTYYRRIESLFWNQTTDSICKEFFIVQNRSQRFDQFGTQSNNFQVQNNKRIKLKNEKDQNSIFLTTKPYIFYTLKVNIAWPSS